MDNFNLDEYESEEDPDYHQPIDCPCPDCDNIEDCDECCYCGGGCDNCINVQQQKEDLFIMVLDYRRRLKEAVETIEKLKKIHKK
jgi:hypothetical protein